MVDVRRSTTADSADLQAIARKTDARLTSLHARFDSVAVRLDQLAAAIAEQREYLERTLQRLERQIAGQSPPAVEPPRDAG
jgi:arginine/ornithine N-succinyltransferase beta subunit